MNALFRASLLGAVVAFTALSFNPAPVQADDYWDNHWSWYDNTYSPYYSRQYASPYYAPGYGYSYGNTVYSHPGYSYGAPNYYGYGNRGYSRGYGGGAYYGTPNVGYREFGGAGGQVRVGPVRFGWR